MRNYITHTRPQTKSELIKAIKGVEKQVKYWKAIGWDTYDINYWNNTKNEWKLKLEKVS